MKTTRRGIRNFVPAVVLACVACFGSGCGSNPSTVVGKPPEKEPIAGILSVWVDYHQHHKKHPSLSDLKSHIKSMKPEQLSRMEISNPDAVFTSPRDNQPYVVVTPKSPMGGVVIYEKTGVGGKHQTATSTGSIIDMSDDDLKGAIGKNP